MAKFEQPGGFIMDLTIIRKNFKVNNFMLVTPVANSGRDPVGLNHVVVLLVVQPPAKELKFFTDEKLLLEMTEARPYIISINDL